MATIRAASGIPSPHPRAILSDPLSPRSVEDVDVGATTVVAVPVVDTVGASGVVDVAVLDGLDAVGIGAATVVTVKLCISAFVLKKIELTFRKEWRSDFLQHKRRP